eukprot:4295447-Alexandrium_andersonii.AAC.1
MAFGPLLSVVCFFGNAALWLLRWMATWGRRRAVRAGPGRPAQELVLWGPAVWKYPATSVLQQAKLAGDRAPRVVLCFGEEVVLVEVDVASCPPWLELQDWARGRLHFAEADAPVAHAAARPLVQGQPLPAGRGLLARDLLRAPRAGPGGGRARGDRQGGGGVGRRPQRGLPLPR